MAVAQAAEVARPQTTTAKIARAASRGPLHITLIAVALLWCIPTIGLALTSFRPKDDILSTGWWKVFTNLGTLTLTNYSQVIHAAGMGHAFWGHSSSARSPRTPSPGSSFRSATRSS